MAAQTVVVPGTEAAATIVPIIAGQLKDLYSQRQQVLAQVDALVEAHPLRQVLTSMPGIGVRTAAENPHRSRG